MFNKIKYCVHMYQTENKVTHYISDDFLPSMVERALYVSARVIGGYDDDLYTTYTELYNPKHDYSYEQIFWGIVFYILWKMDKDIIFCQQGEMMEIITGNYMFNLLYSNDSNNILN